MFTGVVGQLGIVKAIERKRNLIVLWVDTRALAKQIRLGDSVAINGVCLTASSQKGKVIAFDLMRETIEKTSLQQVKVGSGVNLELALKANSRFGGHFVTGHVDEKGIIKKIKKAPHWVSVTIGISKHNRQYLVPKGSVAIDGVSLTVGKVTENNFSVFLIPYSLKATNLGSKKAGDRVNIEMDILAKYLLSRRS